MVSNEKKSNYPTNNTGFHIDKNYGNYKNLIDNLSEVIFTFDFNEVVGFVNKQIISFLGYSPDEFIGKELQTFESVNLINSKARKRRNTLINKNLDYVITNQLELNHRNGKLILFEVNERIIFENNTPIGILGLARNISDTINIQDELKESEEKYKRLIENSPDITYIYSSKRGTLFWSSRAKEILGFGINQYEELPFLWRDSIHKDDIKNTIEQMSNFDPVVGFEVEYRISDTKGNWHWFLDRSINCKFYKDELVVEGLVTDITEKKAIESALIQSESKYRSLFENIMNGFALHEIVLNDKNEVVDYIYIEVNKAFETLTGLKRENIIGKRATDVMPTIKDDPANWIATYANVATTGKKIKFEKFSQSLNKWYSVNCFCPKKGQFATIFEDITLNHITQKKLKEKESMLSILLGNLPGIIYRCKKDEDWTMVYLNGSVFELLGYKAEEIIGNTIISYAQIIHPDDRNMVTKRIMKAINNMERFAIEYRIVKSTGEIRHVWEQGKAIYSQNDLNKVEYIEGYINDITDKKNAQIELIEYKLKLENLIENRTSDLERKNKELHKKNEDLERYNDLFIGREFRIKELREKVNELTNEIQRLKKNI